MNFGRGEEGLYVEVRRGLLCRRKERSREDSTQELKNDLRTEGKTTGERKGAGAVSAGWSRPKYKRYQ